MWSVNKYNEIRMTKGDTPAIQVLIIIETPDKQQHEYVPTETDKIIFALSGPGGEVHTKEISHDDMMLVFSENDTGNLPEGEYRYEISLNSWNYHCTFIQNTRFILTREIYDVRSNDTASSGMLLSVGSYGLNKLVGVIPSGSSIHGQLSQPGIPGLSAYEVAIKNGYTGTEEEWLESLKGGADLNEIKESLQQLEYGAKGTITWQLSETNAEILKELNTKVEGGRITPIADSVDIAQVYETTGCPEYISNEDLIKYSYFGLDESGWYLFARINSKYGELVTEGFNVIGAAGVIAPPIGSDHVDIAVRFGVIAESQKVFVDWGASTETFVFKATDLAIRNLDYRVTFYLYNIDDYCEWEYEITTDTKFVKDKGYYKLIDGQYVKQEVTDGEAIPANTYYCHKSLIIKDFTRNMSYTLDTTVDCPVTIHLPEVGGDNYGAWFEVQMNFLQTYSVTIIPHDGQKVSANGVHSPKVGINIINILYHKPTNTWLPTVTNWKVSDN